MRVSWKLAAAVIPLAIPAFLYAVDAIVVTPGAPNFVGATFSVTVDPTGNASEYSLSHRCVQPSAGPWYPTEGPLVQTADSWYMIMDVVGTTEFKGGAKEIPQMNPPTPTWNYLSKQVVFTGPSSDVITNGVNQVSGGWPQMGVLFQFTMKNGMTTIQGQIAGYPQERIRRPQAADPEDQDSGWVGPDTDVFWWNGVVISDYKTFGVLNGPAYEALPNGTVIDDFYQQNRFVILDCTLSSAVIYTFGERHFQKVKSGLHTFKVIEI